MGRLAKKTTILFEPEEYERLKRVASRKKCSVGELIRSTLREQYLQKNPAHRAKAADELAKLSLPVAGPEEMEEETISGATE